jgi:hypothetical protein
LNKRTSSYLTFLGLKECQHRLIPEKGGGIPFLLFCDNDQYIDNVFSFLLKNITGKTLCYNHCIQLYFMGKTGVPVQGILTSNAVSLNLKICIYIYVEHKYPERRTI